MNMKTINIIISFTGKTNFKPKIGEAAKAIVKAAKNAETKPCSKVNSGLPVSLTSLRPDMIKRNSTARHITRMTLNLSTLLKSISNCEGI